METSRQINVCCVFENYMLCELSNDADTCINFFNYIETVTYGGELENELLYIRLEIWIFLSNWDLSLIHTYNQSSVIYLNVHAWRRVENELPNILVFILQHWVVVSVFICRDVFILHVYFSYSIYFISICPVLLWDHFYWSKLSASKILKFPINLSLA